MSKQRLEKVPALPSSYSTGLSMGSARKRIRELEALVRKLTKERNALRDQIARLQNKTR